ncbi:hypothetical protein THS27_25725 [Thalassospira sp. MCCC 1A01428]|nr:hypothetical protein THS27_25725 [Thalassospira sp. MCCC 1A01428]
MRLINEPRAQNPKGRRNLGRWIYISLLLIVGLWVFDVFFGEFFFLRGDGLIAARPYEISSEYIGTVQNITVQEGQRVAKGDVVANVHSKQFEQEIAEIRYDVERQQAERERLTSQLQAKRELVDLATLQVAAATKFRKRLETGLEKGISTGASLNTAYEREYDARAASGNLHADILTLQAELKANYQQLNRRQLLLKKFIKNYDDGRLRAPASGIVTDVDGVASGVVRPGDPVMSIAAGRPYVLAYFENGSLYDVIPGEHVSLHYGTRTLSGTVKTLLPLSEKLPPEFQRSFQPTDRAQIAEIDIDPKATLPPLFAKIDIGGGLFSYVHRLFEWAITT